MQNSQRALQTRIASYPWVVWISTPLSCERGGCQFGVDVCCAWGAIWQRCQKWRRQGGEEEERKKKGKHFRWNTGNFSRQHRDLWKFLLSSVRTASATRAANDSPSQSFKSPATSTLMHRILTLGHFEVKSHRRVHVRGGVHHAGQLLLLLLIHHKVATLVVVCVTVD